VAAARERLAQQRAWVATQQQLGAQQQWPLQQLRWAQQRGAQAGAARPAWTQWGQSDQGAARRLGLLQQQQPAQQPQQQAPRGSQCRFWDAPAGGGALVRSYGLPMTGADKMTPLPTTPERRSDLLPGRDRDLTTSTLVCLVSTGIDAASPVLVESTISGCVKEHPLDPGGCPFEWSKDAVGRGTHLASIVAGGLAGAGDGGRVGVLPGAELHSVRITDRAKLPPGSRGEGPFAANPLLPYTICEGRLRGRQASNVNRSNYRMVRGGGGRAGVLGWMDVAGVSLGWVWTSGLGPKEGGTCSPGLAWPPFHRCRATPPLLSVAARGPNRGTAADTDADLNASPSSGHADGRAGQGGRGRGARR
jgi:hypothetical protein